MKPSIKQFQKEIWAYYAQNRRNLPWRRTYDPYRILVSETMLQQTQVSRVLVKYKSFLKKFPTLKSLSLAPLREVLLEWQGLGYNRRALFLKKAAETITKDYAGKIPKTYTELLKLPGIGQSTAGAILNFSYNTPTVFIETNIRSVFLHFFFKGNSSVSDIMIKELVEKTLDHKNPREWYYALYDYGAMLKKSGDIETKTIHRKSKHYKKQSTFIGSNRQLRSGIVRLLLKSTKSLNSGEIAKILSAKEEDVKKNLISMKEEGMLVQKGKGFQTA